MTDESASEGPRERSLLAHSFFYSLTPLVRYALSFGMTRFYTSVLIVGLYGVKEMLDLWMILLQHLLGQNLLAGMLRFYFDHSEDEKRDRVITSTTIVLTLAAWAFAGVMLLTSSSLAPVFIGAPTAEVSGLEIERAFRYLMLLVPFQLSSLAGLYWLQALRRSGLYSGVQTAKLVFEIVLHVIFMGVLGWGLEGFLLGLVLGEAATSVLLTGTMLVRLGPRIDFAVLKPILVYAAPLVPVGIFQFCLHQLDRRLIEFTFSGAEGLALAGVYGLGYKVGQLVNSACTWPFMQIWQPTIYAIEDEQRRALLVGRVTTWVVVGVAAASLGIASAGRQLVLLLAGRAEYHAAYTVVPWVAAGYVFWALYHSAQMPLFLAKKTRPLLLINFLALAFSVGANLFLIPILGILGAALATLGSFALLSVFVIGAARRVAPVPFEARRLASVFAVLLAGCLAIAWIDPAPLAEASALTGIVPKALVLVTCLVALWLGVLEREEREAVAAAIKSRLPLSNGPRP